MEVTQPIRRSFADEHVIATDPPMRPELANHWRRRINAFAGRALSDKAMTAEQDLRSGMQRLYGLALTPGVVEGLAATAGLGAIGAKPKEATLQVSPGLGIAHSGEDVSIGRAVIVPLADLPVILRVDHSDALGDAEVEVQPDAPRLPVGGGDENAGLERLSPALPRRVGETLATIAKNAESAALPHVAVLVARPVTAEILGRPVDRCPPDPRDDPYVDLQRIDGTQLALYLWPTEMTAADGGADYSLPIPGPALRNSLAHAVFENERLLGEAECHPWEDWGVPLAILGFGDDWTLDWIDRHAVARVGGTPRGRASVAPKAGDARLWQARIDQFTQQLTELPSFDAKTLQQTFQRVPPVGVLPPDLFDPVLRRQHFFPTGFHTTAVPVAQSNLNLVVSESAGLAPLDRGQPDTVEILVPVPDEVYEPGLLQVEEEDPRFGQAIKALREDRQRWLVRRQMARRRYDRLMETVSGVVMGWPGTDLPLEENSPAPHVQTPVEVTRTRRFDGSKGGWYTHAMTNADATLPVAASDTIWVWVSVHNTDNLTGLSLRLGTGTRAQQPANFTKEAYWGSPEGLPIHYHENDQYSRRAGELPESGVWTRLEIPASKAWELSGASLDGFAINAIEFTQAGGDIEWGSFGKTDANGMVYTYIADDAPAGATLSAGEANGWPWTPVAGREALTVDDFGTVVTGDVRRAAALDSFRADWKQDFLKADLNAVDENGIAAFLASVDARLKATNDAIDLGFVRARSDIYRVRQIMLGADAASRLVTSPALADLSVRDEGARATSKGIADFLKDAVTRAPNDSVIKMAGGAVYVAPPTAGNYQPAVMTNNAAPAVRTAPAYQPAPAYRPAPAYQPAPAPRVAGLSVGIMNLPLMATTALTPQVVAAPVATPVATAAPAMIAAPALFQSAILRPTLNLSTIAINRDIDRYRVSDIQRQIPIAGLVERTASVAERLKPQPAVQALEYALASKAAVVTTLAGLSGASGGRPIGIALGDLPMPGYVRRAEKDVPTLAQLVEDMKKPKSAQLIDDADTLPTNDTQKHESDYFSAAVQAIDNSIAIMRLVEGRVALFEELAESLRTLKADIQASANAAGAYLRSVDVEVAEARHDLATAERLRAEEAVRIDAVNLRRASILETRVNAVIWRRARAADLRDEVPLIEVASGLAPSAVAVCRREHEDAPDEIHDYVQLLREVPVSWFPAISAQVARIEKLESAQAALRTMIERAAMPRMLAAAAQVTATSRYLAGVQNAMVAGRQMVEARQAAVRMLDVSRITLLSLAEAHVQLTQTSTIGDLLSGTHRQPVLTRAAGEEIDAITTIAGCLHESFGEVPAIVRLGWAETLSEFDRPAPLANLAGLPGWGEVPIELRRALQGFVDWLFGRIDRANDEAEDAINELVRVCLLMASQAPVDKIVPAHLIAPAPARLGSKLFLALDVLKVRKGMTTLIRDDRDRIISHAVVDDIVDGRAQATITQVAAAITTITPAMRFELVSKPVAPLLTLRR